MVAETKERMTQVFDTMSDGFRSSVDMGRKMQETWFDAMGEAGRGPVGFDAFFTNPERLTREWFPFMARNVRAAADCFDANVRAGMNVIKTACDTVIRNDGGDFQQKTRGVWDTTFEAMKSGFDAFGKASKTTMDHWTTFCRTTCDESNGSPKSSANKASK